MRKATVPGFWMGVFILSLCGVFPVIFTVKFGSMHLEMLQLISAK